MPEKLYDTTILSEPSFVNLLTFLLDDEYMMKFVGTGCNNAVGTTLSWLSTVLSRNFGNFGERLFRVYVLVLLLLTDFNET